MEMGIKMWNVSCWYSIQVEVTQGSVALWDIKTICGRVRGCYMCLTYDICIICINIQFELKQGSASRWDINTICGCVRVPVLVCLVSNRIVKISGGVFNSIRSDARKRSEMRYKDLLWPCSWVLYMSYMCLTYNVCIICINIQYKQGSVARWDIKTICGRVRGCWAESLGSSAIWHST